MFTEEEYQKKVQELEDEISILKEKLKSYTAPSRNKKFYENHKEELLDKMKLNPISNEKRKEYKKYAEENPYDDAASRAPDEDRSYYDE